MLAALGSGLVAGRVLRAAPAKPVPFPLHDVRLLNGPFLDAQQRDLTYLLSLQPDRMLHNFRVNAGLEPKAPVYGGWESEEPWVDIRCHGHTLGHYLTAASFMYASTGDERMKQRADYVVAELLACQDSRAKRARLRVSRRRGAARECRGGPSVHRRALVHDAQGVRGSARRPSSRRQRTGARRPEEARGLDGRVDRVDDRRRSSSACCAPSTAA